MKWNMRYLFGFLVPFPFPSPVWKTGIICFLSRRSMTCIENFNIPHTQGQPLPPVIRTFDNLHIQIPSPWGKIMFKCLTNFFFLKVKSVPWLVKFPHSPILHHAFSSWIEKTTTKQYIALKTDLFYNGMGLCGNLPSFPPKISTARCFRKFRVNLI